MDYLNKVSETRDGNKLIRDYEMDGGIDWSFMLVTDDTDSDYFYISARPTGADPGFPYVTLIRVDGEYEEHFDIPKPEIRSIGDIEKYMKKLEEVEEAYNVCRDIFYGEDSWIFD